MNIDEFKESIRKGKHFQKDGYDIYVNVDMDEFLVEEKGKMLMMGELSTSLIAWMLDGWGEQEGDSQ